MKRLFILAFACSMVTSAAFAQVQGAAGDQPADSTPSSAAPATISDPPPAEQPPATPPAQDSLVLANGKVRIGAVFFGDWALYDKTGFGPQFVTQTNFPGPNNNNFNSFDVHRTYLNLYFSPSDHVTLRVTPNIYREIITGTADKAGATGSLPASADGNLSFRLKYAYLEFGKLFEGSDAFKNTNIRVGQQMNPMIDWEEALWDYRFVSLVGWNYLSLSSAQVGVSMNGPIGSNGKTYLDYQIGVFNDASFHAFEYSEQKQFMVRGTVYPMGAKTRFQGLGITGFYDHAYTNNAPDTVTTGAVAVQRTVGMVHYTTPGNNAMLAFEYDRGSNAFSTSNMFSGDAPQDLFGLATTVYANMTKLDQAVLAGTSTKQAGWAVYGRANVPGTKLAFFGMDQYFQPNTNIPTDPLDFYHVVAGFAYRVSPRWRFAFTTQHVIYKQDQFTYPATSLAVFSPTLAAANPGGIANAVPTGINAKFLSLEFTF